MQLSAKLCPAEFAENAETSAHFAKSAGKKLILHKNLQMDLQITSKFVHCRTKSIVL